MTCKYVNKIIMCSMLIANMIVPSTYSQVVSSLPEIEQQLIADTLQAIQQTTTEKNKHFERISCSYKITRSKVIKASVKTHFLGYRQKAEVREYSLLTPQETNLEQSIEITYRPCEKKKLIVVSKKNNKRQCKYVDIA